MKLFFFSASRYLADLGSQLGGKNFQKFSRKLNLGILEIFQVNNLLWELGVGFAGINRNELGTLPLLIQTVTYTNINSLSS